jgi:hypothetical protein
MIHNDIFVICSLICCLEIAEYKDPNLSPLQRVIKEIIATEYDYVNDLNILDSVCVFCCEHLLFDFASKVII